MNLRGVDRQVVFNHGSSAVDAEAVVDYADPVDTDPYAITIRFLEL